RAFRHVGDQIGGVGRVDVGDPAVGRAGAPGASNVVSESFRGRGHAIVWVGSSNLATVLCRATRVVLYRNSFLQEISAMRRAPFFAVGLIIAGTAIAAAQRGAPPRAPLTDPFRFQLLGPAEGGRIASISGVPGDERVWYLGAA